MDVWQGPCIQAQTSLSFLEHWPACEAMQLESIHVAAEVMTGARLCERGKSQLHILLCPDLLLLLLIRQLSQGMQGGMQTCRRARIRHRAGSCARPSRQEAAAVRRSGLFPLAPLRGDSKPMRMRMPPAALTAALAAAAGTSASLPGCCTVLPCP